MRARLALGGGGVRGFFHLGLLSELQKAGVEIEALAGTSAGALAAAAYAFGLPLEVEPILEATKDPELLRLSHAGRLQSGILLLRGLRKPALASNHRYREGLRRLFQEARLEDAPLPVVLLAADLLTGEPVYLRRGPVVDAVLASSSIPGVFPPLEHGDRLLVDGDVVEKVPTSALLDLGNAPLVAVDVSNPEPKNPPQNSLEAALLAGEASRRRLKALALERAEIVVSISLDAPIDTFDFHRAEDVYQQGRETAPWLIEQLARRRGRRLFGWLGKAKEPKRKQPGRQQSPAR